MNARNPFPDADTLWQDISTSWSREGVAYRCLRLQDQHGLCAPLVLVAIALGLRGIAIHEKARDALAPLIARWHFAALVPLRASRRALKETDDALYEQAKQVELALERRLVEEAVAVLRGRALWNAEDAIPRNIELVIDAHGPEMQDGAYFAADNLARLLEKSEER